MLIDEELKHATDIIEKVIGNGKKSPPVPDIYDDEGVHGECICWPIFHKTEDVWRYKETPSTKEFYEMPHGRFLAYSDFFLHTIGVAREVSDLSHWHLVFKRCLPPSPPYQPPTVSPVTLKIQPHRSSPNSNEWILKSGRVPIIVGGSNSYIEPLVEECFFKFKSKYECCFLWLDVNLPFRFFFVSKRVHQMVYAASQVPEMGQEAANKEFHAVVEVLVQFAAEKVLMADGLSLVVAAEPSAVVCGQKAPLGSSCKMEVARVAA
ncbi:unnamed protein product [Fraxinus pennsylvanica]|uniref:Uncharacterized protein n=1 Tax=Fraxinus pennsylvanica TaxID=56036 RepID=A0AAD2ECT3_9LAMI|nr:unnamed protein product [Fraxinus pennsylvanica]